MKALSVMMILALAACSPSDVADQIGRRAASSVVMPVVSNSMPAGPAQIATNCIVENASAAEVQALARDVAAVAGSSTKATIRAIALRPEAQNCFAANSIPPVL